MLALYKVFEKLVFQDNFPNIQCSMHRSSARKKISSNTTLSFYTCGSYDLRSSLTFSFFFTLILYQAGLQTIVKISSYVGRKSNIAANNTDSRLKF